MRLLLLLPPIGLMADTVITGKWQEPASSNPGGVGSVIIAIMIVGFFFACLSIIYDSHKENKKREQEMKEWKIRRAEEKKNKK